MSIDNLRKEYGDALRCYNAMETTKRRHFGYMSMLDAKQKKFNLAATEAESDALELLLRDHHEEVLAFKRQCELLKKSSESAHKALFEHISYLGQFTGSADAEVTH